MFQNVLKLNR